MAKRFTKKCLENVVEAANGQAIEAPYNGVFEVQSAYGDYRVVSRMPDTWMVDLPGCHRGTARECAEEFLEYLRRREDVTVSQYLGVAVVYDACML